MNSTNICNQILLKMSPTELFTPIIDVTAESLSICGNTHSISSIRKIRVLGIGKAAAQQVDSLCQRLSSFTELKEKLDTALVLTKYDHSIRSDSIVCLEGGHPLCDQNSVDNTQRAIDYVATMKENDLLIACISGGASSVMTLPIPSIELNELNAIFLELLGSGATIEEINAIRKEISLIKNGGMASCIGSKRAEILLVSDVSSDQIGMIGSGPFYFTEPDLASVILLINKFLSPKWATHILGHLMSKDREDLISRKRQGVRRKDINHTIISDFNDLMTKSNIVLNESGFKGFIIPRPLTCSIEEGLLVHISHIKKMIIKKNSSSIVSGGEIPITVRGSGQGGRNTEFVLQLGKKIFFDNILNLPLNDLKRITITSLGTDGTDGPTEYAGAFFDFEKFQESLKLDLDIDKYLQENDSLSFFQKVRSTIKTGPTGTNLMDLRIITISKFTKVHVGSTIE